MLTFNIQHTVVGRLKQYLQQQYYIVYEGSGLVLKNLFLDSIALTLVCMLSENSQDELFLLSVFQNKISCEQLQFKLKCSLLLGMLS